MITYQAGPILLFAIALAVISQRLRSCICEYNSVTFEIRVLCTGDSLDPTRNNYDC